MHQTQQGRAFPEPKEPNGPDIIHTLGAIVGVSKIHGSKKFSCWRFCKAKGKQNGEKKLSKCHSKAWIFSLQPRCTKVKDCPWTQKKNEDKGLVWPETRISKLWLSISNQHIQWFLRGHFGKNVQKAFSKEQEALNNTTTNANSSQNYIHVESSSPNSFLQTAVPAQPKALPISRASWLGMAFQADSYHQARFSVPSTKKKTSICHRTINWWYKFFLSTFSFFGREISLFFKINHCFVLDPRLKFWNLWARRTDGECHVPFGRPPSQRDYSWETTLSLRWLNKGWDFLISSFNTVLGHDSWPKRKFLWSQSTHPFKNDLDQLVALPFFPLSQMHRDFFCSVKSSVSCVQRQVLPLTRSSHTEIERLLRLNSFLNVLQKKRLIWKCPTDVFLKL